MFSLLFKKKKNKKKTLLFVAFPFLSHLIIHYKLFTLQVLLACLNNAPSPTPPRQIPTACYFTACCCCCCCCCCYPAVPKLHTAYYFNYTLRTYTHIHTIPTTRLSRLGHFIKLTKKKIYGVYTYKTSSSPPPPFLLKTFSLHLLVTPPSLG